MCYRLLIVNFLFSFRSSAFAVLCLMKTGMVSTDNVFEKPCAAFGATPMINFDKTRVSVDEKFN